MLCLRVRALLPAAVLAVLHFAGGAASSAGAQSAVAPLTSTCDAGVSGSYQQCALWLDVSGLRQGLSGDVIARYPRFIGAMSLAAVVEGDSAQHYARLYQRDARRANVLGLVSLGMSVGAAIVLASYDCNRGSFGYCTTRDDEYAFAATGLMLGSLGLTLATIPLRRNSWRNASKSVFWHNARFARP